MSRLGAWIQKDDMERQDIGMIIDDDAVDIEQWRMQEQGESDGFRETNVKRRMVRIDRIRGRIDRRDAIYRTNKTDSGKVTDQLFIATVYKRDVRVDDVLRLDRNEYRVKFINKTTQSFTECELEIKI